MNIFSIIILGTLLGTFFIKLVADILNMKAAGAVLPVEFQDVYDQEAYEKSQNYLRHSTVFSLVAAAFELLILLVFWFAGGFNFLDSMVRGLDFSSLVTGILYIGILLFLQGLVSLPFSIYQTFVLEEKYGFNKTTPLTFVSDKLKGVLLGLLLGTPVLAGLLWFFENSGSLAWVWAWVAVAFFGFVLQYVAPTVIMPLFNKFTPLEDGELKSAIMGYAKSVDFPLSGIFVIDGSKRSSKANAFFTGFGKQKRIALFDTLIENHTVTELVAVLAHEIGHYKKKHIVIAMFLSIINMGIVFFLLSIFLNNRDLFDAFYMENLSVYASLLFFSLLYSPVEFVLSVVLQSLSRRHEFQADHYAVETYSEGSTLVEALKKLSRTNLSNLTPHPFYVFLNYSHPPVLQRIERIRRELSTATV
ncbi:M48 family metallopeptidase [Prosthecochloris sp. SCSIO W1103]|uniref:M48 family metallopeptidase n=1 Tax=Prosthecochloris sp. SCSIO W1103 TaxID=2992244 RepID=UPI00223E16DE|nr:M48 family metallopeptidase [Prosthecochloris sp. SCSIO W1103]UZJ38349.1 M48 family metallopeptidase [Prosthecochloris sp. SCSIO W1103]